MNGKLSPSTGKWRRWGQDHRRHTRCSPGRGPQHPFHFDLGACRRSLALAVGMLGAEGRAFADRQFAQQIAALLAEAGRPAVGVGGKGRSGRGCGHEQGSRREVDEGFHLVDPRDLRLDHATLFVAILALAVGVLGAEGRAFADRQLAQQVAALLAEAGRPASKGWRRAREAWTEGEAANRNAAAARAVRYFMELLLSAKSPWLLPTARTESLRIVAKSRSYDDLSLIDQARTAKWRRWMDHRRHQAGFARANAVTEPGSPAARSGASSRSPRWQ